jgi:hypothetical protein
LNPREVTNILNRAVEHLKGEPEHVTAQSILSDLPLCDDIVASRCEELLRLLETVQEPTTIHEGRKAPAASNPQPTVRQVTAQITLL